MTSEVPELLRSSSALAELNGSGPVQTFGQNYLLYKLSLHFLFLFFCYNSLQMLIR